MVDQIIDKRTVAIPGPIGIVTPQVQELRDQARTYRDQAQTYAAGTVALQDQAVADLIGSDGSATSTALLAMRPGLRVLWVGDSFSAITPGDGTLPGYMRRYFPAWDIRSVAVPGTGYQPNGSRPWSSLLDDCPAGFTPDLVVFAGSVNDQVAADYLATVRATYAKAAAKWPRAMRLAIPGIQTSHGVNAFSYKRSAIVTDAAVEEHVAVITGAEGWLLGRFNAIGDDNFHPNQRGLNEIAAHIASAIRGSGSTHGAGTQQYIDNAAIGYVNVPWSMRSGASLMVSPDGAVHFQAVYDNTEAFTNILGNIDASVAPAAVVRFTCRHNTKSGAFRQLALLRLDPVPDDGSKHDNPLFSYEAGLGGLAVDTGDCLEINAYWHTGI